MFDGVNWHTSKFEKKEVMSAFPQTLLKKDCSNMACYNFVWGLHCHCGLMTLTVSRSLVCQKYKQQIACFGFLSSVFKCSMVATYISKIMLSMIFVTLVCVQGKWLTCFFIGQVSGLVENFIIGIYSDTINVLVINVKICMMALLTELYLFIPLSETFTIFHRHNNVKQL